MNKQELINLQKIFIDNKDWNEVSKLQYEIDNTKDVKPIDNELSPAFKAMKFWFFMDILNKLTNKVIDDIENLNQL